MASKSKGLHYEKQEPAFLRRLRAEHAGDRREFQASRPKNAGLATSADDDDPTIVDEEGRSVTKEEYQAMVEDPETTTKDSVAPAIVQKDASEPGNTDPQIQETPIDVRDGQRDHVQQGIVQSGSTQRKRKQGKVIGADEGNGAGKEASKVHLKDKNATKPKPRKAKKVKLSFEEGDAE